MTDDARAALVEWVRGEFWAAHQHIRGGATFDEVIEFFLKREQAAMERTRELAALEAIKWIGGDDGLASNIREMGLPLPDATGEG